MVAWNFPVLLSAASLQSLEPPKEVRKTNQAKSRGGYLHWWSLYVSYIQLKLKQIILVFLKAGGLF